MRVACRARCLFSEGVRALWQRHGLRRHKQPELENESESGRRITASALSRSCNLRAGVDVPNGFAIRLLGARYFEDAPIGWYLYRCNNSPKLKAITWDRAGCATWDFRYSFPTPCVGKSTLFPSLREVDQMDPLNALLKFQGPTGHATHAVHPLSCLPYFGTVNLTHSHMPAQRTFPPEFRFQNRAGVETHPPKNMRCDPAWFNCDRMSGHMAIVYSNATAVAPPTWMFNAPSWCRIGHESLQECGVQH